MIEFKDKNLILLNSTFSIFTFFELLRSIDDYKILSCINYAGSLYRKIPYYFKEHKVMIYEDIFKQLENLPIKTRFIFFICESEKMPRIYNDIRKVKKLSKTPIIFVSEEIYDEKELFDKKYIFYKDFIRNIDTNTIIHLDKLKILYNREKFLKDILHHD